MKSVAVPELMLEQVTKVYGTKTVLAPTTLAVGAAEILAVVGPSGCGKTTLLSLLAGLTAPTAGRILVAGRDMRGVPPEARGLPMVFQEHMLFPHMSVQDNVAFGLRMRRRPKAEIQARVGAVLTAVQLSGHAASYPAQLSGGQRQRVALARAMVVQPRAILMDEPFSSLDTKLRQEMRDLVLAARRDFQFTVVIVTHDPEEALSMADRVAVMRSGHVEQCGTPADVYLQPQTHFVATFLGAANMLPLTPAGAGSMALADGTILRLAGRADARVAPAFACIRPEAMHVSATPAAVGPSLPAVVRERFFVGAHITMVLDSSIGPLRAQVSSLSAARADDSFAVGAAVHVQWGQNDVALVTS